MKIVLIQPPNEFLKQAYGVKLKVSFGHTPPLGLAIIASYLELDAHDIQILDAVALGLSVPETVERVANMNPDLIGITALTNYADFVKVLSENLKERMPDKTIVLGGPHATYYQNEILSEMPGVDHVIYGEADLVIRKYVKLLETNNDLKELKGLVYRGENGKVIINDEATIVEDLDTVPFPAWHLLDMSLYRPLPMQYRRLPWFALITSRGCWWRKCTFCFQAGRKAVPFRKQTPERVVAELAILHDTYGIREVNFFDDAFITNRNWLKKLKEKLKEKKLDICWTGSGRADSMNEDVLKEAKASGCWSVFIGVESGDRRFPDRRISG